MRRYKGVAFFAALLLVLSAVPVLADEPPVPPVEKVELPPSSLQAPSDQLPDAIEVREGIGAVEREEAARERELESPQATREREESQDAFKDVGVGDAQKLLQTLFADQLAMLNTDPARSISSAEEVDPVGATVATVTENGDSALLDAGIPVRTENEDGDLRKVDLGLEATTDGFETTNALSDVQIGDSAAEPIVVGEEGISISQLGADQTSASRRFGEQNVFQFEALTDTDTLVSPTANGVEIFNLLRSEESPETFRFEIDMPQGAELRPDGRGGAMVIRDGETLAAIPFPTAVDAQGADVPVDFSIERNILTLKVDHREGDYAMPILLDPILEDWVNSYSNWQNGHNLHVLSNGAWQWTSEPYGLIYFGTGNPCHYTCWGRGLYLTAPSRNYGANVYSAWSYHAPNIHSYISKAWLIPFWRDNHGCSKLNYPQPHDYDGLWDHIYNGGHWNLLQTNQANDVGNAVLESWGRALIFGLHSGGGINIPCWRDIYVGGAAVWLDDWNPPHTPTASGAPSGWLNDASPVNVNVNGSDEGLGVYRATIAPEGKGAIPKLVGCTGLYGSRCPTSTSVGFNLTGLSFGEGVRNSGISVEDPTGKVTSGNSFQTKVDRTPPEVTLSGQLAQATNEGGSTEQPPGQGDELSLPVYNLKIEATDGSNQSNLTRRSGVKDIEIWLDGVEQTVPWSPQIATEDSRSMTQTYQFNQSTLTTAGQHTLEVKVRDQVNNIRPRKVEFEYIPATGLKDEYVMHYFPLPDGSEEGEEEHPERPELAVNVMNGNLVYREQDIDVEGAAVDLEVERYYNSMLPTSENTEWGDGWTLAQTPDLDPVKTGGSPVPNEAKILNSSGVIKDKVPLPTEVGTRSFDPILQATVEKKASGGYELTDETGESPTSVSFDATGQAEALLTEGHAKVDYTYEGGELAEIEVKDPATFAADPAELEIPEPQLITVPTFASSFGSNGAGDGQLKAPADVAVDAQGNLWVVDKTNNRIQKFDAGGKFLAKFGSLGSGDGQFNRPTAIAIASNGNLLVTDAGNGRVQRFSSTGAFISKFGSKGTGNGQFTGSGPEGIAIDTSGNIWVSDTYGGRLQKFTSAGEFIKAISSKGSGAGQLGEPTGLDIDPSSGDVWVADWQNHRVAVFNNNGEFVSQFGSLGSGDGQFNNPDEIEIDKLGSVWVGDQNNYRIQQFDLSGQFKAKFGSYGSGPGQFSFTYPFGIATDSRGRLWVADVSNHRIQEWLVPVEKPIYISSFGAYGTGDGQLKFLGDVAVGLDGNLWVVDKGNNRIQKFDPSGKFLAKFGSAGSGDGQFNRPTAVAVDRDGNLLVADAGNNRIQKFDPSGKFLAKFGSAGTGNGQFSGAEGVTADMGGNIWVADTYNGRIQKFDESGKFIEVVSSYGSGLGQLGEPTGLDVDPSGNIWVADWQNNRIAVFDKDGDFVGQFGSQGSGPGQFSHPDEIDIDGRGNVWIGDQSNNRVQRFDLSGLFVGQFGSGGTGEGQFSFSYPMGIAADRLGRIWVADVNNHRVQRWQLGNYFQPAAPELDLSDGDPQVEVETPGGLVTSVTGNAAGEHGYTHTGDDLTAHDGPAGEIKYKYDPSGRMTEVTLPNGTRGSIAYYADNRVKSVTVDAAGAMPAKTTTFEYTDAPTRRTVVIPPDAPHVTYDIGEDGSVLKWWNALQPPEFDDLAGTLYENRNKEDGLLPEDHYLDVQAHSEEGISSIEVITNGTQLVHETACEQTEAPGIECKTVISEWVTNTELHAPGYLNVEVLITDRLGQSSSERFWVDIPEPPPPPAPGTPIPPKFADILRFREDYGLEIVFPVANEIERNERIFNLINAWYEGDPVARASWQKWGIPLRPVDVAELEYRDRYVEHNVEQIEAWAETNYPGTYAGYYLDHRAGGIFHVGFTQDQGSRLADLKAQLPLEAEDRMAVYPTAPSTPRVSLGSAYETLDVALDTNATFRNLVTDLSLSESGNDLSIGTTNVPQTQAIVNELIGAQVPRSIYQGATPILDSGRHRTSGRMRAGDKILNVQGSCTAAFGAYEHRKQKSNGEDITAHFVLTAGHCFSLNDYVHRSDRADFEEPDDWAPVGQVTRNAYHGNHGTDGLAIRAKIPGLVPLGIFGSDGNLVPTGSPTRAKIGNTLCYSGATLDGVSCGEVTRKVMLRLDDDVRIGAYNVKFRTRSHGGDSGAPVWNPRTGAAVGVISGHYDGTQMTIVSPLLHPKGLNAGRVPGILNDPDMLDINLITGN